MPISIIDKTVNKFYAEQEMNKITRRNKQLYNESLITQEYLKRILYWHKNADVWVWLQASAFGSHIYSGDIAGHINGKGYHTISIKGISYLSHRLVYLYEYGVWPIENLDHKNKSRACNNVDNLRESSMLQNSWNKGKQINNTTGFIGVIQQKSNKRYQARLNVNGVRKSFGTYKTAIEAAKVRDRQALKYRGEFAELNFPALRNQYLR